MKQYFTLPSNFSDKSPSSNKTPDKQGHGDPKPPKDIIDFLLNYSKSLEAKKGMSYQLN
jgi:hypothetical protein